MSVVYSVSVINSRLQQVVSAIDAGASNGFLRLTDAGSIVSSFQLSKPSATVSGGVLSFSGLSLIDPAAVGGTATSARCEDSNGNVIFSGLTVNSPSGTSDIVVSPTNVIAAGAVVALTAATITGK